MRKSDTFRSQICLFDSYRPKKDEIAKVPLTARASLINSKCDSELTNNKEEKGATIFNGTEKSSPELQVRPKKSAPGVVAKKPEILVTKVQDYRPSKSFIENRS